MNIGQTLTKKEAMKKFTELELKKENTVVLKEDENELIEKFEVQKESYAIIYKKIENKKNVFELIRLSNVI